MARNNPTNALEELAADEPTVRIMRSPPDSARDYVVWAEHAAGPAPNAVQVFHDHHPDWLVEMAESGPESMAYYVTAPEGTEL